MDAKEQRALITAIKGTPELSEAFTMPTLAWSARIIVRR